MWGMDTALGLEQAERKDRGVERLTSGCRASLLQAEQFENWRGPDADEFRSQASAVLALLDDVAEALGARAEELRGHVAAQNEASAAERNADDGAGFSLPFGIGGASGFLGGRPGWMDEWENEPDRGQPRDGLGPERGDEPASPADDQASAEQTWNAQHPSGPTWDEMMSGYREGPPDRPEIEWDDDFPFESKKGEDTFQDHVDWAAWGTKMDVARAIRPDLDDALDFYDHYRSGDGTPMVFDFEEAYQEDPSIRSNVDASIRQSQYAAQQMIDDGRTDFSFTGPNASAGAYPETENWQKTVGGYQQWSSGDVSVDENGNVTMVVTVHAEDHYNFNRGANDIASNAPDDANGRFSELGWAQGFDSSGSVERVVTWNVNDPDNITVSKP